MAPDNKVYILYKNPADPGPFWYEKYETKLAARQVIWRIRDPDFNPFLEEADRDRWESDPTYRTKVIDGIRRRRAAREAPSTSEPQEPIILAPASDDGPSRGIEPPLDLRSIEPDIITGRDYGVRQVEPQVRSTRRPDESLTFDENAPRSSTPDSSASPAPRDRSQTRPVRRPRPDAPTGFPGVDRRPRRQDRPAAPDRRRSRSRAMRSGCRRTRSHSEGSRRHRRMSRRISGRGRHSPPRTPAEMIRGSGRSAGPTSGRAPDRRSIRPPRMQGL